MDNTIRCEACGTDFPETAPYLSGIDALCEECAPTYQSLLDEPDSFVDSDEEPLSPEAAREWVDSHLAAGGKITDKILNQNNCKGRDDA